MDGDDLAAALSRILPAACISRRPEDLRAVARDESDLPGVLPVCRCRPETTEQVAAVIRLAAARGVPVTARGGGSGLEGGAIPSAGGLVLDLSAMDRVLEVSPEERLVRVQPGVVHDRLNRLVGGHGLFFPPSPGGSGDMATIGGMVSTDASGIYALRHGGTRRWVRGIEVVTGTGDVMRVGGRVPKSSAGYDLKSLFIGSEGTLGILTEVTLGLEPVPPESARIALAFPGIEEACRAAAEMAGYVPEAAAVEIVDRETMGLLRGLPGLQDVPEAHLLMVETQGRREDCAAGMESVRDIAAGHQGTVVTGTGDPWALRHRLTRTIRETSAPGGVVRTDCAVPLPALATFVREAKAAGGFPGDVLAPGPRRVYVFGHGGVGIVHCLLPLGGPGAWTPGEARAARTAIAARAVALGGTVSGEHGIGIGQREVLAQEHPHGVAWMRRLKALFDPHGILNPGKVL
ncbi:MAG TPA: FAD-binding oxidoreductase [Myxococcota bacterium]|nr:FAD-binding oxidoreductase [Myxococcota bacterium]HQK52120.1 FAD-binding oxidoreductase [Myxococcota bacterium]